MNGIHIEKVVRPSIRTPEELGGQPCGTVTAGFQVEVRESWSRDYGEKHGERTYARVVEKIERVRAAVMDALADLPDEP